MDILISNASDQPIYEQIARQIQSQIVRGELEEGELLPSIRRLAKDLQVSVITTSRAYEELAREGFINLVAGKGCYVAAQNEAMLQERRLKMVEDSLVKGVEVAKNMGMELTELISLVEVLYRED
jgi:GntR family transcriptional regulator